jgi:hypothetical protein
MLMSACGSHVPRDLFAEPMTYKYPSDDLHAFRFSRSEVRLVLLGGRTESKVNAQSGGGHVPPAKPVRDCSTAMFRCLSTSAWVFVVPAGALTPGTILEAANAHVKVLGCIPDTDKTCDVAILESRCLAQRTAEGAARLDTDCRDTEGSSRLVYVYSRRRGVLAFDEASNWPETVKIRGWKLESLGTTAAMYALVGDKGIFAPD